MKANEVIFTKSNVRMCGICGKPTADTAVGQTRAEFIGRYGRSFL